MNDSDFGWTGTGWIWDESQPSDIEVVAAIIEDFNKSVWQQNVLLLVALIAFIIGWALGSL